MDARTCLCRLFLTGALTNYQLLVLAHHAAEFPDWAPWLATGKKTVRPEKLARQRVLLQQIIHEPWTPATPPLPQLLTVLDADYPERLLAIYDPPAVLAYAGHLDLLRGPAVGVVGTRTCSDYGRAATAAIVPEVAAAGAAIISGLARGVDGLAHRLAIGAGGHTIAVIGTGLDLCYPREHTALQQEIMRRDLVLSPFPPGTAAKPYHFPQRNRVIAGLCHTLLVIEARERSGSLITAALAADDNRIVAAVPGRICDPQSAGCNALIADGAVPVHGAGDVLRTLPQEAY